MVNDVSNITIIEGSKKNHSPCYNLFLIVLLNMQPMIELAIMAGVASNLPN